MPTQNLIHETKNEKKKKRLTEGQNEMERKIDEAIATIRHICSVKNGFHLMSSNRAAK